MAGGGCDSNLRRRTRYDELGASGGAGAALTMGTHVHGWRHGLARQGNRELSPCLNSLTTASLARLFLPYLPSYCSHQFKDIMACSR